MQGLRHGSITVGLESLVAFGLHGPTSLGQSRLVDQEIDLAVGNVDANAVALFDQADGAALGRLGRDMADAEARGSA